MTADESIFKNKNTKASQTIFAKNTKPATKEQASENIFKPNQSKTAPIYLKWWFWLILVILIFAIVGGIVAFSLIQKKLDQEAVKSYDQSLSATRDKATRFETSFNEMIYDAGFSNISGKRDAVEDKLRERCLEKFSVRGYQDIKKAKSGKELLENEGRGKVEELNKTFTDAKDKLVTAENEISKCREIVIDEIAKDVKIEIGKFKATFNDYGVDDTELPVKITNVSDARHSFRIEITGFDKNGKEISKSNVYAFGLEKDESADKKAFGYIYKDEEAKALAEDGASFKVTKISEH